MLDGFTALAPSFRHGSPFCKLVTQARPISKTCTDFGRTFYHTTCITLLEPFVRMPFLNFSHGRSARALLLEHSAAIISVLKEYDVAFLGRHDYWLLHTCEIAVRGLLLENLVGTMEDSLAKGCELLYNMGRYMPQANAILLDVSKHSWKSESRVSERAKRILQAGSIRVQATVIKNAWHLKVDGDEPGLIPAGRIAFREDVDVIES